MTSSSMEAYIQRGV